MISVTHTIDDEVRSRRSLDLSVTTQCTIFDPLIPETTLSKSLGVVAWSFDHLGKLSVSSIYAKLSSELSDRCSFQGTMGCQASLKIKNFALQLGH